MNKTEQAQDKARTHIGRLEQITKTMTNATNDWPSRHHIALALPEKSEAGFVSMLKGWLQFADSQTEQYDRPIGSDYYTGDIWARIGLELRQLLSCDIGSRLDCGTIDGIILGALEAEGFNEDGGRNDS